MARTAVEITHTEVEREDFVEKLKLVCCRFMQKGVHSFLPSSATDGIYIPQSRLELRSLVLGVEHKASVMQGASLLGRWAM